MSTFEEKFLALDNNERVMALLDIIEALAARVGSSPEQLHREGSAPAGVSSLGTGDALVAMTELTARVRALEAGQHTTGQAALLQAIQCVIADHVADEIARAKGELRGAIAAYLSDVGSEVEKVLKAGVGA